MAAAPTITLDRLNKRHTLSVTVKISRQFRLRVVIAGWLFWLASRVLGCGITITIENK